MPPMSTRRSTLTLLILVGALLTAVAPGLGVGATNAAAAKPSNFKIAVNGRILTSAQLNASAETYFPLKPGRMQVAVRWANDLRGTGYSVVIVNSAKTASRRCTTGTSCIVSASKPLGVGNEVSWSIQIKRSPGNKLLSEKVVCLIGKA